MTNPYEVRYDNPNIKRPAEILTNEFIEKQFTRKTIRHYDPERKISIDQLRYLIAAAQCSPSSSGVSSWSVIVLSSPEEKAEFKKWGRTILGKVDSVNEFAYDNCSAFLIWLLDNFKVETAVKLVAEKEIDPDIFDIMPGRIRDTSPELHNLDYQKTPLFDYQAHCKHLDESYYTFRAMHDAVIAAQTFSLLAESLGMGTMYIGSVPHGGPRVFSELLNLPKRTFPVFGMCVGYEHPNGSDPWGNLRNPNVLERINKEPNNHIKPIQPIELVMHQGTYKPEVIQDKLKEYNSSVWQHSLRSSGSPSDYLLARVVCRISKSHDHVGDMKIMGNNFE